MSEVKLKCTLTDNELVDKSNELVSKLCETGGHSWCLRVPVDLNNDPDIIFTELGNRVLSLSAQLSEAQREIGRMNISLELQADRVDKLIDENVKAEAENAALREQLKKMEEAKEYKDHEFCKDVECTALEYNTCSPVICHKTAKHFHKWLKQHGYKIVKVASIV